MADSWHVSWLSEGVERWNRRRRKVDFSPDLSGVNFFKLLPADFRDSPKTSRFFEGIDLSRANLIGADLSGLNFQKGSFVGADLTGANMSMSNFNKAKFAYSNLSGADISRSLLVGTLFEYSLINNVSFEEANVARATFIGSELDGRQRQIATQQSARVFEDRDAYGADRISSKLTESSSRIARFVRDANEPKQAPIPENKYDVFFGTDRTPVYTRGALTGFDENRAKVLSYGVCEVMVPDSHRIGSLGSPLWKRLLKRKDDRLRLGDIISLNGDLFWSLLKETSQSMKIKERPTIYVHGFNNTFEQAVLRAAQIGYDLGLGQGIGLFSWPSKGRLTGYTADEASSEASKYALADFIEQFVDHSEQKSINIIAHSMGCRSVLGSIEVLSINRKHVLKRLNQVILAAADVDSAVMPYLGLHVTKHAARTTSYISNKDTALKISGWLHSFPRVGITPPTFLLEGMDTVLVNDLDLGEFSHSYMGSSRTILSDIFSLLKENSPPYERHALEAISLEGRAYWRIKD